MGLPQKTKMSEKQIVVDCRDHLLGRLASTVAKELLCGQKIICVRCEDIVMSGGLIRNRFKFMNFLRKRMATNPKKGPYHYRNPGKFFWRVVRGMLPHKTARGAAALERLKVFEGVPPPFDKMKRVVVPNALRVLRLKKRRKYTVLGKMCSLVGWKYCDIVSKLETKRKIRAAAYYSRKKALAKLQEQAKTKANKSLAPAAKTLAAVGL